MVVMVVYGCMVELRIADRTKCREEGVWSVWGKSGRLAEGEAGMHLKRGTAFSQRH